MEKKLRLPTALAVVVLGACGPAPAEPDSGMDAGEIVDAGSFDAGCDDFEEYDPVTMQCVPLV